jgi:hypothetical protein
MVAVDDIVAIAAAERVGADTTRIVSLPTAVTAGHRVRTS